MIATIVGFGLAAPAPAVSQGLETYGDIGQFAIPGVAALISVLRKDPPGVLQLGVGTAATVGVVQGLKFGLNTERPDGGSRSFPSGHTSGAFSGASYLHYRYGWQYGLPAYGAAALVGYSRVDADRHWWYDVVAGAAIANLSAYIFTDTFDENVVIIPVVNRRKRNFGIIARIRF